ncbi:MAG: glycine betaine ABC transporter substrate-binding protein [Gammaproteobacteria bacterium]
MNWDFFIGHVPELGTKIFEQINLVVIATLAAVMIGLPCGIWISRFPRSKTAILGVANILQTIPSLALLTLLLPFVGIGFKPALIALTLYALLPIIRNTVTGIEGVPAESIEAARGLGFTYLQRLWLVELPLALPVIVAGIRTAVVISTGIATIAAFIGAGGLGDFINRGLATNDMRLVMLGAIPAALLALLLDMVIARIEKLLAIRDRKKRRIAKYAIVTISSALFAGVIGWSWWGMPASNEVVRVATKNFTEQFILGEIIAQTLEAKTDLTVERKFNLGTTDICHAAMIKGEIDIYPEYTGTALLTILHQPKQTDAKKVFAKVSAEYQELFAITWLAPFGFENTQAIAVQDEVAKRHNLNTISDVVPLASTMILGAPAEFTTRADAGPALEKIYNLRFKEVKEMQPGLMYQAIKEGFVDGIFAFSTDGRLTAYRLKVLRDDKQALPPYDAAPLIRTEILHQHPEIVTALAPLANAIDATSMQQLNYLVDIKKQDIAQVAHQFLVARHIVE